MDADTDGEDAPAAALPPGMAALFLPILGGKMVTIAVDEQLVRSVNVHQVTVEGGRNYLFVLTDRYPSRAAPGDPCADGEEIYVRVVEPVSGEEKWHMLAHSCLTGVTAATEIVTFDEDACCFTVNLTSQPPVTVSLVEIEAA